jgi:hypothetical protein
MKRIAVAVVLALTGTSCSHEPPAAAPPPPAPTRYLPPPMAPVQQTPRPRPPAVDRSDVCGAKSMQSLIGKQRTEIPVPVDPNRRRVTCTTCPVTQDFRPDRINILYDADTGVIKEVKCG